MSYLAESLKLPIARWGVAMCLAGIISLFAAYSMIWQETQTKYETLDHKLDLLRNNFLERHQREAFGRQYKKRKADIAIVEMKLSNPDKDAGLAQQLERLTRELGVEIVRISNEKTKSKPGYDAALYRIELRSTYAQVRQLLQKIQSIPYFVSTSKMVMKPEKDSTSLRVSLNIIRMRRVYH